MNLEKHIATFQNGVNFITNHIALQSQLDLERKGSEGLLET